MQPQDVTILRHFAKVGSISGVEANAVYRCRSLSKRVSTIDRLLAENRARFDGVQVDKRYKRDPAGQRYVRYHLQQSVAKALLDFVCVPLDE